jgi:hypothetical protein
MRPPACVRCKWGTGTTCEKQPDTVASKEVKSNFEKMMAERAKQDAQWFATKDDQTNTASSASNDPGNTRK